MELTIGVYAQPEADFNHPTIICPDEAVTFTPGHDNFQTIHWDFGDGHSSTATQASHQYEMPGRYTVTLTLNADAAGCMATATSEIEVLERPDLSVVADTEGGCPPLQVCFIAQSNNAQYVEWQFADGNSANSINPCHTFTESGLYPVTVRSVNARGCASAFDTLVIRVYEQPVAQMQPPPAIVCGFPQEVQFISTSEGAVAHQWHFSNGAESQLRAPQVTFSEAGKFTIVLEVENTFGCSDALSSQLEVKPRPLADFSAFYEDDCVPQEVIFDNFSTDADSYVWLFGNGEQSTKAKPVQLYEEAGQYDITLIVGQDGACFDTLTLSREVTLRASPVADFSWETPSPDYEGLIQFINHSQNAVSYHWD
ncbi:MAG: PKD domain-containing protein, partial [Bacteroidetes bacterium]